LFNDVISRFSEKENCGSRSKGLRAARLNLDFGVDTVRALAANEWLAEGGTDVVSGLEGLEEGGRNAVGSRRPRHQHVRVFQEFAARRDNNLPIRNLLAALFLRLRK